MGGLLLVYTSYTGHTHEVAELISSVIDINTIRARQLCQADTDQYGDIMIGFPIHHLNCPEIISDFIVSTDWYGRRVFFFATCASFTGSVFHDLPSIMTGSRIENELIIRYGRSTRLTSDDEIIEWASQVGRIAGIQTKTHNIEKRC